MDSAHDLDRAVYLLCKHISEDFRRIGWQKAPEVLMHRDDQAFRRCVDDFSSAVRGQIVDGVAEGFHQIAAKGHVVLSAHARPSAVNQRPQIVVRLRELSMTNQSGSLVGGIGIILKPFSISRSSAERGILASAVTRRS